MGRTSDAKQRLMDAIIELVWTGSYGKTTIDLICEKAEVKKGSFYYFFDSKTDLIVTAIRDSWEHIYRPKMDGIFSASVNPLERLKRQAELTYEEQLTKYQQYGHVLGCPLFTLGNEISTQEQELRDLIDQILSTHVRYLETALRDAAAMKLIHCPDPAFMARALFLYQEGALAEARIKNDISLLKELWPSVQKLLGSSAPPVAKAARKAA
jgi:TetR/AcrR family transcriptional repressor of nem operon